jgi:hypothetical protein
VKSIDTLVPISSFLSGIKYGLFVNLSIPLSLNLTPIRGSVLTRLARREVLVGTTVPKGIDGYGYVVLVSEDSLRSTLFFALTPELERY